MRYRLTFSVFVLLAGIFQSYSQIAGASSTILIKSAFRQMPDLFLRISFRIPDDNPVVRFCYELVGKGNHQLTKSGGTDNP